MNAPAANSSPPAGRRIFPAAAGTICAVLLLLALSPASASAGSIRGAVSSSQPVQSVAALLRQYTEIGVYSKEYPGKVSDGQLLIEGLPPGRYDLRFRLANGSTLEGWDAQVPPSDYVQEQPLSDESRRTLVTKMSDKNVSGYDDQVVILDIQGNAQNAAVLSTHLRWREFVGGHYKAGEWTWRVRRSQWEYPDEDTWVPYQERPYYALVRLRFYEKDYAALRISYARHLGGIAISGEKPDADLGKVLLPNPAPGVHAVNPDGSLTQEIVIRSPANDREVPPAARRNFPAAAAPPAAAATQPEP